MVPLAHGLLAPGHGAGSGARQRSGQDPKNHRIIRVLAPARRDGGRGEAARPLEVGCRRDAPAWVTQHLASGASAGVRRRASSDEAMGRRGHAPGAAGGALAEALPGGRRGASTLWAMATPGGALPEGFGSLCRTATAAAVVIVWQLLRRVGSTSAKAIPWLSAALAPCWQHQRGLSGSSCAVLAAPAPRPGRRTRAPPARGPQGGMLRRTAGVRAAAQALPAGPKGASSRARDC